MKNQNLSAAEALNMIAARNRGNLTPEVVLAAARAKSSALHHYFTWDDTEAANQFRLIQAGYLIRRIRVTYMPTEDHPVRVRAYVNVHEPNDKAKAGRYIGVANALESDRYRDQIYHQCQRDIESFMNKYRCLTEAASIIAAMEDFGVSKLRKAK